MCADHESPVERFCKTCNQLVCQRCTIRLHQHHDHVPVTDELLAEQKQQIMESLLPIKKQLSGITVTLQALETRAGMVMHQGEVVEAQVDTAVEQAMEVLQESRKKLKDKAQTMVQQELQALSQQREKEEHNQIQLKDWLEEVEEKLRAGCQELILADKFRLVEQAKVISSHVTTNQLQPVEEVNITFVASKELLSHCSNLGELNSTSRCTSSVPIPSNLTIKSKFIETRFERNRPHIITGLTDPWGVAISASGEVVVSENTDHPISVFSQEGKKIRSIGLSKGQLRRPRDVALTSDNSILVADGDNRIHWFTLKGRFVDNVGQKGKRPLEFNHPTGITVGPSDRVYIADSNNHRIQVLSSSFEYFRVFGRMGSGQGQFNQPQGVACDNNGTIYVADYFNGRVQKFSTDGQFVSSFGSMGTKEGELLYPSGICIDSTGTVYITEWGNHRVSVFTSTGQFIRCFGSKGSGKGQFMNPTSIAVNSTDNLFVCDHGNGRVVVY